jgi:hypothetical protein
MLFHQRENKKIYWQIHAAGLVNQMMSVETGAGIAFMEKKPIYFYKTHIDKNRTIHPSGFVPEKRKKLYDGTETPSIFDLVDIPKSIEYNVRHDSKLSQDIKDNCVEFNDILGYYYKCADGPNESSFAEGRKMLPRNINSNLHFVRFAFAYYSRFFFNRPKELDHFFNNLTFRKPYLILARQIAKNIGSFRGMHIRLTDHADKYNSSAYNIFNSQEKFINTKMRFIVSTDDKERVENDIKIKCTFVDDVITDYFHKEFMRLPYHNEVVFGLISLLVMSYAEEFIGTPGSTFSSYIHRLRINNGLDQNLHYIKSGKSFDNYQQNGPYSWNGFDMHTNTKNWWCEWRECKLCEKKH